VVAACSSDSTTASTKDGGSQSTDGSTASTDDGSTSSGDDGSVAPVDGSTFATDSGAKLDAAVPLLDGGDAGSACVAYCDCMGMYCNTTFGGAKACLAACAAQSTWDLPCRTMHCGFAAADALTHCPHASGAAVCQ
jgi:hypothetical protein